MARSVDGYIKRLRETPLKDLGMDATAVTLGKLHLASLRTIGDVEAIAKEEGRYGIVDALLEKNFSVSEARAISSGIGNRRLKDQMPNVWYTDADAQDPAAASNGHAGQPKLSKIKKPNAEPSATPLDPAARTDAQAKPAPELPIRLELIKPSPYQCRKTFDPKELEELAATIKEHGVLQPIVVRPTYKFHKGGEILPETYHEEPHNFPTMQFELVAGERRWRAAKLAGLDTIPAKVHQLSDKAAYDIVLIENDQRADVPILEKAEGYARGIEQFGYTVETLAAAIKRSKSTVHGLIKMARDLPPAARKAVAEDKLPATTAMLIARIPNEQLRQQATKEILAGEEHLRFRDTGSHEPMNFRAARQHVRENYMVELKIAPFPRTELNLVPSAGACTVCPKMTGNNRDAFPAARGDICTDPLCFRAKKDAWNEQRRQAAAAGGAKVLSPAEVKKEFPHGVKHSHNTTYANLADKDYDHGGKTYKQLLGKKAAVEIVLAQDDDGDLHELAKRSDLDKALVAAGVKKKKPAGGGYSNHSAAAARDRAADQVFAKVKLKLMADTAAKVESKMASVLGFEATADQLLRTVAAGIIDNNWSDVARLINKRRGIERENHHNTGHRERLAALIPTLGGRELIGLLAEVCAARYAPMGRYNTTLSDEGKEFFAGVGIDFKKVMAQVKSEQRKKKKK